MLQQSHLLGTYLKNAKILTLKDINTPCSPTYNTMKPKCPRTEEWIRKMWGNGGNTTQL